MGNTPVGIIKPEGVYRIYADQIDTPRLITDDTNRPVWQWDAKPFGDSQPNEDLDGNGTPFHYNLRFPGQYYDAETKTHYNFNRDYEPETGRYVQSDPVGLQGGLNSFSYTDSNPIMKTDPSGLEGLDVLLDSNMTEFGFFNFAVKPLFDDFLNQQKNDYCSTMSKSVSIFTDLVGIYSESATLATGGVVTPISAVVGVTAQVISTANGVATITICGVDKSTVTSVISAISNGYIAISANVLDIYFNLN